MPNSAMTYDIHIRTADGSVRYPHAFSHSVVDQILRVQVGDSPDESDTIYFCPGYWQQYVVDPHNSDPLGFDDDRGVQ
jgi:hypothetical protein